MTIKGLLASNEVSYVSCFFAFTFLIVMIHKFYMYTQ